MKRRPRLMSGTTITASIGDRQIFRIQQVTPFLAIYKIGDGPTRWTLRSRKVHRLAKRALAEGTRVEVDYQPETVKPKETK